MNREPAATRAMLLRIVLALVVAAAASAFSPRVALAQISEVLRVGDGAPTGGTYRSLKRPESAGAGRATFIARTTDGLSGIYSASAAPGAVVTYRGEITAAGEVRRFSRPAANAAGEHAWQARTSGVGTGVFADVAASGIVAVKGNPVGLALLDTFERPAITDVGDVVFFAELSTFVDGIFRCSGGNGNCDTGTALLEQIVAVNDTYFDSLDAETRVICSFTEQLDASNWGIALRARTARAVVGCGGTQLETVLRKQYGGGFEAVAKTNDPALPGPVTREHFRFDGPPEINNDGDVAFLGETIAPVDDVIYFCDVTSCPTGVSPQPVVVQRATDIFGNALTRFKAVGMSDANEIVFQTVVELALGGKTLGIYLAPSPGVLQKIIANHDLNGGFEFRRLGKPSMSSDGYVAFEALVKDGFTSQFAVFVYQ